MNRGTTLFLVGLVIVLVVMSLSMFTVDQRQNAIVFRLGEPVQVITKPGADRADGWTTVAHRLGERRSFHGWVFFSFGGRWLSAHHRAGRICFRDAGGPVVLRRRVQRGQVDQDGVRV